MKNSITITYTYNPAGQRVKVDNGTISTVYPNKAYNTDGINRKKNENGEGEAIK